MTIYQNQEININDVIVLNRLQVLVEFYQLFH